MELTIWLISSDRKRMIENQRAVNRSGSMRTACILSQTALDNAIASMEPEKGTTPPPDLIMLDDDFNQMPVAECIDRIRDHESLAGVPLFISAAHRDEETDSDYYALGAIVVVHHLLSQREIQRMERVAWQYAKSRQYEKKLQTQAARLREAKEILELNRQLDARNRLLYRTFRRYFSQDVMDTILAQGEDLSLGGEKREVTIMMSDLRGFTALSENMDSARVTALLNHYFTCMVEIITRYHGTVIEFLGDGLLTVFGAPLHFDKSADSAVSAAIEMQNAMEQVNRFCRENQYPPLEMGIGLHYGEVFVGNIGSEQIMRYNVIGSAVNECSRIESFSVGGQVLASEELIDHTEAAVLIANTTEITAKGLSNPVTVYELSGIADLLLIPEQTERMLPIGPLSLELFILQGKKIEEEAIQVRMISCNSRRAEIIPAPGSSPEQLQVYDNVKIRVCAEDISFDNLYAKVISRNREGWVLHYTTVAEEMSTFVQWTRKLQEEQK